MSYVTRFAPSPTGPLHLGHAYSALVGFERARKHGGTFLLRMDDIDSARCRPEYETQAIDDLAWLGITWPTPIVRQSRTAPKYKAALEQLNKLGLTYPCRCSRKDIAVAASAPQEGAPMQGPDGQIYPGTCRHRTMTDFTKDDAIRLNMAKVAQHLGELRSFTETGPMYQGHHQLMADDLVDTIGDVVVARRFGGTAYHLAVVIDDHLQNVTEVTRGIDLFDATRIHVVLQQLLGLPSPQYHHHDLIRDDAGKRLAKRDDARAIATYRENGATPQDIRKMVGL